MTKRQQAKIILDSISSRGVRLTTIEVVFPRIVLAEFNTHRMFSRNSASSRAIPIERMLEMVRRDPYIPERWGSNGKGMQDHGELNRRRARWALWLWLSARWAAMLFARALLAVGVHKQTTNRLLEPFMWHVVIVTSTEWGNFDHLRRNPAAHPAIQAVAEAIHEALAVSTPTPLQDGEWHTPYIDLAVGQDAALTASDRVKVSCARCARVSYLTHDGRRDVLTDLELYDRLLEPGHMSPFEHAARPLTQEDVASTLLAFSGVAVASERLDPSQHFAGNFRGWRQHRKDIAGEADILGHRASAA